MSIKVEYTDFLVIGGGVAGLRAAIELARTGNVLVITKARETSTEYAQGGVAVALSDEDEVRIHYEDTIRAGDGLCNEKAVKILVEEGPERILELISWGAEFDREGTKLAFTQEAAHTRRRILHAHGDATGGEIERVLLNKVRSISNISKYEFAFTIDLLINDGICRGALLLKESNKEIVAIISKAVILATGGAGQLYVRTTNPPVTTGDGIAIAYRAGAILEDMEFVQFHPTTLYAPRAPQFLLSEAMRGEGGILRNINGERVMSAYHPSAELAPRDIVSRSIISEMVKTKARHVYLDLTHLSSHFVKKRFPRIYSTCLLYDIDITEDLIPVCPSAHYIMGGVKTDTDGRTNIKGLFAAGEVACTGVHGANRLASNSLLEGLVYGPRAGKSASEYGERTQQSKISPPSYKIYKLRREIEIDKIRTSLRRLLWDRVGIIRCKKSLDEAKAKILKWDVIMNHNFAARRELELKNMVTVAELITEAAVLRKGSIGAHYRSDFPERGKNWKRHIKFQTLDYRL
ncbi:MAG: L-aspartate oxidase [Nitrospirae bacterium]|nr:L-aspartate oxidase [Nitrospirota bacterium]